VASFNHQGAKDTKKRQFIGASWRASSLFWSKLDRFCDFATSAWLVQRVTFLSRSRTIDVELASYGQVCIDMLATEA